MATPVSTQIAGRSAPDDAKNRKRFLNNHRAVIMAVTAAGIAAQKCGFKLSATGFHHGKKVVGTQIDEQTIIGNYVFKCTQTPNSQSANEFPAIRTTA